MDDVAAFFYCVYIVGYVVIWPVQKSFGKINNNGRWNHLSAGITKKLSGRCFYRITSIDCTMTLMMRMRMIGIPIVAMNSNHTHTLKNWVQKTDTKQHLKYNDNTWIYSAYNENLTNDDFFPLNRIKKTTPSGNAKEVKWRVKIRWIYLPCNLQ